MTILLIESESFVGSSWHFNHGYEIVPTTKLLLKLMEYGYMVNIREFHLWEWHQILTINICFTREPELIEDYRLREAMMELSF